MIVDKLGVLVNFIIQELDSAFGSSHFLSWVKIRDNWEKRVKHKIRFKGTQEIEEDITEFARELVAMVERLAMRWSYTEKNFKVNNLVDILRESKNKKVLGCNWNEDPAYGLGKGKVC